MTQTIQTIGSKIARPDTDTDLKWHTLGAGRPVAEAWVKRTYFRGQNASSARRPANPFWGGASNGEMSDRRNFYFEGDTIYSYGPHFPLAIRMIHPDDGHVYYLLNGDWRSNKTAEHQQYVRSAIVRHHEGAPTYIIPFSALEQARIEPKQLVPLDREPEKVWTETIKSRRRLYNDEQGNHLPYNLKRYSEWVESTVRRHLLGAVLFRADLQVWDRFGSEASAEFRRIEQAWVDGTVSVEEYAKARRPFEPPTTLYYLSGLDETGRVPEESYFLTQLPGVCASVAQAKEMLKPFEIRERDHAGLPWVRQGDWFFYPADNGDGDDQAVVTEVERHHALPSRNAGEDTRHIATRFLATDKGEYYVKGTIRHTGRDHKMVKLGNRWHRAIQNRQVAAWTATGSGQRQWARVD